MPDSGEERNVNIDTAFDDMPSDLAGLEETDQSRLKKVVADINGAGAVTLYRETCKRCNGSGRYRFVSTLGAVCLLCNGAGYHEYKTSPDYRQKARTNAAANKTKKANDKAQAWRDANPEASVWLAAGAKRGNGFACDLSSSLTKWGSLTAGQLAAVLRCIESDKVRVVEQAKAAEAAPKVDSQTLEAAFAKAKAAGLKWPKIKLGGIVVSPASATSANAGALYAKQDGIYLGKVIGGRFMRSRDCDEEQAARVAELVADPAGTAKAYGIRTGECCVCSRELTDVASIALGVGPICAEKWGFI